MYRQRLHLFPKTIDGWNEVMRISDEMNKINAARGWVGATMWMPTVGSMNDLVAELDYPDLATFQREWDESSKDSEIVDLWRALDAVEMERPGYTELFESAATVG
jgi:hypothetical protein